MTIRSVAEDAGVSIAAVSKVLRNAYGVSENLRSNVEESIARLGYRPSTAARAMRGRTYTVGLLLVFMDNPFVAKITDSMQRTLSASNYKPLIGVGDAQASIERSLIDAMLDMHMDGVVLVAPRLSGELLEEYAKQIPMVVIGHHQDSAQNFDTVNSNDRAGASMAVQALIDGGRKKIHMISLPELFGDTAISIEREKGYLETMAKAGRSSETRIWRLRERAVPQGISAADFFAAQDLPDGVFCWSDIHAVEILNQASLSGVRVPEDMAVVGYDNTPQAGMPLLGLSSIDQRPNEIGRAAAEALLSRIEGRRTPEHIQITPHLVARRSSSKNR